MLSVDCHEPATVPTPPAIEAERSTLALRRLAFSLAPERGYARTARSPRRDPVPTITIPPYSRIVFRAGTAVVR
jgi:hypothetical protein